MNQQISIKSDDDSGDDNIQVTSVKPGKTNRQEEKRNQLIELMNRVRDFQNNPGGGSNGTTFSKSLNVPKIPAMETTNKAGTPQKDSIKTNPSSLGNFPDTYYKAEPFSINRLTSRSIPKEQDNVIDLRITNEETKLDSIDVQLDNDDEGDNYSDEIQKEGYEYVTLHDPKKGSLKREGS